MKINEILKQPRFAILSLALGLVSFAFATGAHAETVSYFTGSGNTTLQGWNNRVWDGAALAWVDLAPDVTAMPGDINGGAILPTPGGGETNGLFAGGRTNNWLGGDGVGPNTETDRHANTLWLRSPQFILDGSGDLTVTLFGGSPNASAPTSDAAIPSIATTGGGWKGVALRRVSDGAFVLTGVNPAPGSTVVTFTQAQLTGYEGEAYTLDLINMDKGTWGWTGMNHVVIPGSVVPPTTPPPAPTNLVAAGLNAQVALSWTASSGATGYTVKRSTTSGGPYPDEFAVTGTSYVDRNLVNDTTYYYVVSASNSVGPGVDSAEVSATPFLPAPGSNLIVNGEFENTSKAPHFDITPGSTTEVPGWISLGTSAAIRPEGFQSNALGSDGLSTGQWAHPQTGATLSQTIPSVAAGDYIFSFDAWARQNPGNNQYLSWVVSGPDGFSLSGDTDATPHDGFWHLQTVNLTLPTAGDVAITFTGHGGDSTFMDQVAFETATTPPASDYTTWATTHGFDPLHPEAAGNDGLTNLLVYGLDLKLDGTNGSPGTLTGRLLSFNKRADAITNGDVSWVIETSTSLESGSWTAQVTQPAGDSSATISYTLPDGAGGGKIFARLVVTQN